MNFYFLCATQPSNMGDLLINKMLIEELCKYGYVYIDCYNIPIAFKRYILENDKTIDIYETERFSIKKGNIIKFCHFLKKNDIKCFTQSPGPLGKLSRNYALYFKIISYILKFFKIKYCLIGNCCSKAIAFKEGISINNADAYYIRSKSSLEHLMHHNIKNVHYIPDLAFLYRCKALITQDSKIVTLCFREIKADYNLFIEWLKHVVSLLTTNGYRIELVYQVYKDKDFTYKIQHELSKEFKNIILVKNILWYDNINYYSGKTIIISNRLHSLLLGAIHNAIPLAYSDNTTEFLKIKDVYNSIFNNFSSELFISMNSWSKLQNIINNYKSIKNHISEVSDYNSLLCHETIKEICSKILI